MELWMGFPRKSVGKESACNAGDPGLIPELGRSSGRGNGNPLCYSCLENPKDRGAWQATVHRVERVGHDLTTKEREMDCETNFFTIMNTSAIIFHSLAKAEVLIHNNKQLEFTQKHTYAQTHTCPSQRGRRQPEIISLSNLEGCRYSQLICSPMVLFAAPRTIARQAPLSMKFSREE